MNELKFRAFIEELHCMTYFHLDKNEGIIYDDEALNVNQTLTLSDIMRYTGVKDKDGTEIYENDIVESRIGIAVNNYRVEYEEACFWLQGNHALDVQPLYQTPEKHLQVIGNTFVTPELVA